MINSIIFWEQPIERLKELRKRLKPNGLLAITLQPRSKDVTDEMAHQEGGKFVQYLKKGGFIEFNETKKLRLFQLYVLSVLILRAKIQYLYLKVIGCTSTTIRKRAHSDE